MICKSSNVNLGLLFRVFKNIFLGIKYPSKSETASLPVMMFSRSAVPTLWYLDYTKKVKIIHTIYFTPSPKLELKLNEP
jgi:hypothetical protein